MRERILGCIVGGAIGDALGGPYEGAKGPFIVAPDAPWTLSDDTQLTLATCEAIIEKGMPDPEVIAGSFARWFRAGRITRSGASTLKALRDLDSGAHWALAGRKGDMGAGNGAAMRIAPLAFCVDPRIPEARTLVRDVCRITHHEDEAYCGALAVVVAIRAVVRDQDIAPEVLLTQVASQLPCTVVHEQLLRMAGMCDKTLAALARQFGCSAYVAESVPLALCAAAQCAKRSFEEIVVELIQVGGDTDTTASIAGQVAGARLGFAALPPQWIARLPERDFVESVAEKFAATVTTVTNQAFTGRPQISSREG